MDPFDPKLDFQRILLGGMQACCVSILANLDQPMSPEQEAETQKIYNALLALSEKIVWGRDLGPDFDYSTLTNP